MANYEIGSAYLSIIPTVQGIQGSLTNQLGGLQGQANQAGAATGNSFLGGLKGKALGGIAAVGLAVGAAFADAFAEAVKVNKGNAKLQASLGVDKTQAQALGKSAGALYAKGYGASISDLQQTVGDVFNSLDISDPAKLEAATGKALSFADAFDTDVSDAIQSVSTLMKSGLAKNADEAFDLLTKSSQHVPAALRGDIADASDEYGQFFRALGFSGEQAFDALVEGSKKGTFGIDKTGDAIKEFTLLATDMGSEDVAGVYDALGLSAQESAEALLTGGDTAKAAFNKIIEGLVGIENPTQQASAALALFGTPLEDMNKADIPEFLEGLKGASGWMENTAGAAAEMDTAMGSTTTSMELLWRGLQTFLVGFINDKVIPAISAAASWLGEKLGPVVQQVTAWLGENLGPTLQKVADFFTLVLVPALMEAAVWFQDNLLPIIQRFGQFFADTFGNLFTILGGFIDFLIGVFTGDWSKAWEGIKQIFGGIWDQIKNIVSLVWDTIQGVLSAGWNWIKTNVLDPMGAGLTVLGDFFSNLWLRVQQVWTWISDKITAVWNWIRDWIFAPLKAGIDEVGLFFSNLWGTVQNVWTWISDKITGVWNWINANVFAPMILGINTIMTWMSNLWTTVEGVWNKISGFFSDVAKGISDAVTTVKNAIKDIANAIGEFLGKVGMAGRDTGSPLGNAFTQPGATWGGTARGGVIPGTDPGRRDNVLGRLPNGAGWGLRSEEAVMVPEFTHAVGGASGVYALNRLAEAGRLKDLFGGGFARGGVVGTAVHDAVVNPVKSFLTKVKDQVIASLNATFGGVGGARGAFLNAILSKQGTRYVWGAAGPDVFDCSGLMSWGLQQAGVGKGRLTAEGFNSGFPATNDPKPGDMVTFDTGRIPGKAGHIGAVLNPAAQTMMHTDGAGPARIQGYAGRPGFLRFVDVIGGPVQYVTPGGPNGATGDLPASVGGSGVDRWRGLAMSVLQQVGAYRGMNLTPFIGHMLNQIRTESGGNPDAINNWDSNARRGDPSIGLLQVIGSTFRSALRGTPFEYLIGAGQRNPMASMVASTLYSLNRYGSLDRAWRGVAYDTGGWLMPGGQGVNLLNKPEAVLTPAQSDAYLRHARALEDGFAGRTPGYTFNGDIHVTDPAEFFRETAWQARKARV